MSAIASVPLLKVAPEGGFEPRRTSFPSAPDQIRRRGFLRVLAVGGMTVGLSALSWVPVGNKAHATVGTEYGNCTIYSSEPGYDDTRICWPYLTSPFYCGTDKWFKNGCFARPGTTPTKIDCFRPLTICNARNAWRWVYRGVVYRCADGEVKDHGTTTWMRRICSARL